MSKKADQAKLYKEWKKYLSKSRLADKEISRRAKSLTKKGMKVGS